MTTWCQCKLAQANESWLKGETKKVLPNSCWFSCWSTVSNPFCSRSFPVPSNGLGTLPLSGAPEEVLWPWIENPRISWYSHQNRWQLCMLLYVCIQISYGKVTGIELSTCILNLQLEHGDHAETVGTTIICLNSKLQLAIFCRDCFQVLLRGFERFWVAFNHGEAKQLDPSGQLRLDCF